MTDAETEYNIGLQRQRDLEKQLKASNRALRNLLMSDQNKDAYRIIVERQLGDLHAQKERSRAEAAEYKDRLNTPPPIYSESAQAFSNSKKGTRNRPKIKPENKCNSEGSNSNLLENNQSIGYEKLEPIKNQIASVVIETENSTIIDITIPGPNGQYIQRVIIPKIPIYRPLVVMPQTCESETFSREPSVYDKIRSPEFQQHLEEVGNRLKSERSERWAKDLILDSNEASYDAQELSLKRDFLSGDISEKDLSDNLLSIRRNKDWSRRNIEEFW